MVFHGHVGPCRIGSLSSDLLLVVYLYVYIYIYFVAQLILVLQVAVCLFLCLFCVALFVGSVLDFVWK